MRPSITARRASRAWLERTRVAALSQRILDVDRTLVRHAGLGVLTSEEAAVLLALAARLGVPA